MPNEVNRPTVKRAALDNLRINSLLAIPGAIVAFPFLTQTTPRKGCCGREVRGPDYSAIKVKLASLDEEAQQKLLKLLGTEEAVVYYSEGAEVKSRHFKTKSA